MKNLKIAALVLCAALAVPASAGCQKHKSSSSSSVSSKNDTPQVATKENFASIKIPAEIAQSTEANDTGFKLNFVMQTEVFEKTNTKYIYLNVDITNNTDETYTLSSLNNFWLKDKDDNIISADLITRFYAIDEFKDITFYTDPFEVPAHETISGYVTGYEVDPDLNEFTIEFFPTKGDIRDKETVVQIPVKAGDIKSIPDEIKK